MPIRSIRSRDFYVPIISVLRDMGGIGNRRKILERAVDSESYSEQLQLKLIAPSGHASWALSILKKLGYLESAGWGKWKLTSEGVVVDLNSMNIDQLDRDYSEIIKQQNQNLARDQGVVDKPSASEGTDEPSGEEQGVKNWLLQRILELSSRDFEFFCKHLLGKMGFEDIEVTPATGDGGFDGEGVLVINPLVKTKMIFECKRYSPPETLVSTKVVRALQGKLGQQGGNMLGLIVTTGRFSKKTEKEAQRGHRVELVDGDRLVELCQENEVGVKRVDAYDLDYAFFKQFKRE